jgi:hypothetical protein
MSGMYGNKRRPPNLKGSKVGANEAERSSFVSIYTAHASASENDQPDCTLTTKIFFSLIDNT